MNKKRKTEMAYGKKFEDSLQEQLKNELFAFEFIRDAFTYVSEEGDDIGYLRRAIGQVVQAQMNNKYRMEKEGDFYRIYALRDFGNVKAGDKGGLIKRKENLSHDGTCWIYDEAKVYGKAQVYGDAQIRDRAEVYKKAEVFGKANIGGHAQVYGQAQVYGRATVEDHANIYDHAQVFGTSIVRDYARIRGEAELHGGAIAFRYAEVGGYHVFDGKDRIGGTSE